MDAIQNEARARINDGHCASPAARPALARLSGAALIFNRRSFAFRPSRGFPVTPGLEIPGVIFGTAPACPFTAFRLKENILIVRRFRLCGTPRTPSRPLHRTGSSVGRAQD